MIRTQIQLEERQAAAIRALAAKRGVSMATLIRQAIDEALINTTETDAAYRRALSAVGRFRSGRTDVSEKHDEHFVEASRDR